jgi:hypothetical protein
VKRKTDPAAEDALFDITYEASRDDGRGREVRVGLLAKLSAHA